MITKSVDHKLLNKFVWILRDRGLWVERHSYSFRIMYNNVIIGSLHIYPGFKEAVLRIHSVSENESEYIVREIKSIFNKLFPDYVLNIQSIT